MTYNVLKIGEKTFWTPNPSNVEELRETLHEGVRFYDYNPNDVQPDNETLKMFM
jgi:hypothetical protein